MTQPSRLTFASALNPPPDDPDYLDELGRWAEQKAAEIEAIPDPGIVDYQGNRIPEPDVKLGPAETKALLHRSAVITALEQTGALPLTRIPHDPPPPLLLDRLDPTDATVLFGDGGAGKGTIASSWIVGLTMLGRRVLVLDYENHPDEWSRRIHALGGVEAAAEVLHVSPVSPRWQGARGAIWDHADDIRALVEATEADYLVVDSAVPACGATNPLDPEAPGQYFAAIARIGLPSLTLAHATKAGELRFPFGSVFWHNLCRLSWAAQKQGGEDSGHSVLLTHRKGNNVARQGRYIVTVTWHDGVPREVDEQAYSAKLSELIDEALAGGSLSVNEIVARLNADLDAEDPRIKPDSVRAALRRGVSAKPQRFTVKNDRWLRAA